MVCLIYSYVHKKNTNNIVKHHQINKKLPDITIALGCYLFHALTTIIRRQKKIAFKSHFIHSVINKSLIEVFTRCNNFFYSHDLVEYVVYMMSAQVLLISMNHSICNTSYIYTLHLYCYYFEIEVRSNWHEFLL